MNDSIHIQIQMIKFRQQCRIRNNVINLGIAFADPAVKLKQHDNVGRQYTNVERHEVQIGRV